MDYIPPPEISEDRYDICQTVDNHFFRDSSVLPPYYGLDQGIPPLYTPIIPSKLKLLGRVTSSIGTKCELVEGAIIEAWQIDATRLSEYRFDVEHETNVFEDGYDGGQNHGISPDKKFPEKATTTKPNSLRDISCRGNNNIIIFLFKLLVITLFNILLFNILFFNILLFIILLFNILLFFTRQGSN
jgi:hypothetical protein